MVFLGGTSWRADSAWTPLFFLFLLCTGAVLGSPPVPPDCCALASLSITAWSDISRRAVVGSGTFGCQLLFPAEPPADPRGPCTFGCQLLFPVEPPADPRGPCTFGCQVLFPVETPADPWEPCTFGCRRFLPDEPPADPRGLGSSRLSPRGISDLTSRSRLSPLLSRPRPFETSVPSAFGIARTKKISLCRK